MAAPNSEWSSLDRVILDKCHVDQVMVKRSPPDTESKETTMNIRSAINQYSKDILERIWITDLDPTPWCITNTLQVIKRESVMIAMLHMATESNGKPIEKKDDMNRYMVLIEHLSWAKVGLYQMLIVTYDIPTSISVNIDQLIILATRLLELSGAQCAVPTCSTKEIMKTSTISKMSVAGLVIDPSITKAVYAIATPCCSHISCIETIATKYGVGYKPYCNQCTRPIKPCVECNDRSCVICREKMCQVCKGVIYCSIKCRRIHKNNHRSICKKLRIES